MHRLTLLPIKKIYSKRPVGSVTFPLSKWTSKETYVPCFRCRSNIQTTYRVHNRPLRTFLEWSFQIWTLTSKGHTSPKSPPKNVVCNSGFKAGEICHWPLGLVVLQDWSLCRWAFLNKFSTEKWHFWAAQFFWVSEVDMVGYSLTQRL